MREVISQKAKKVSVEANQKDTECERENESETEELDFKSGIERK